MKIERSTPPKTPLMARAIWAAAHARATSGNVADICRRMRVGDVVAEIVNRGAAPVGSTTATGFAAELSQSLVSEFLASLQPLSAAATLINEGLQITLGSAGEMKVPQREGGPSTSVVWVGEHGEIPVREYGLNNDAVLAPKKTGFIVAISRELAKRANGEAVVRELIREDASVTLDAAYFNANAGSSDAHAGMLDGIDALEGFPGADRHAAEVDLAALAAAVAAGGSGRRCGPRVFARASQQLENGAGG